ncbi:MAG: SUMF1/EgtB/PvdO family nonheme iron enzyme [Chloroflexi bacterium]|nr:SUMF1/EgtB/PvdO family nonheme iron enzyme [Chloroflexota bacterium]
MARIFISYSRTDEPFARRLATSLSNMGADIWIDVEDIPAGMKWSSAIQQGLDSGDLLIVIISPESMSSRNVEDEWQYYLDNGKPVIPVLLKPAKIHFQLNRIQYIDFHRQPYDTALYQLYAELRRKGVYVNPNMADPAAAYQPSPHQFPPVTAPTPKPRRLPLLAVGVVGVLGLVLVGIVVVLALLASTNQQNNIAATATTPLNVVVEPTNTRQAAPTNTPTAAPTNAPRPGLDAPVTRNADWSPVLRDRNGIQMALVPIGCFTMGSSDEQIRFEHDLCRTVLGTCTGNADEAPPIQICFQQPFWIGRTEVTNAQYGSHGAFAGDNLPRTNITWEQAAAFCDSRGMRLPTEAEWEYAARGPDGLIFPWGNRPDSTRLNYCDRNCEFNWRDTGGNDGYAEPAPVGSYPTGASWVGALDMSGNVWEWTSTIYTAYPYQANDGREDRSNVNAKRTLRGSSWNWIASDATTTARDDYAGDFASSDWYGFRCARDFQPGDLNG